MKSMKKILCVALAAAAMTATFAGCSSQGASSGSSTTTKTNFTVGMVTDTGGINDQSYNQSAWTGLQAYAKANPGVTAKYLESTQSSDYSPNLNQFANSHYNLVWGVGYLMADAIKTAATAYPNSKFAIVDSSIPNSPKNLTSVLFKPQESSFLVGYIAAQKTKTNKIGFIGGVRGVAISQFEYGFRAGVAYGAKELNKNITVDVQYANSFSDASLGKAISQNMYSQGNDIVFAAAGNVGQGVITEAKEVNKYCIGVDMDQSYLAPNNMLTSAMKDVNKAVEQISADVRAGKDVGGKTFTYGLKENCVGIPYTAQSEKLVGKDVLDKTKQIQLQIIAGKIVPPETQNEFNAYMSKLQ